jgi:hypothetical protein
MLACSTSSGGRAHIFWCHRPERATRLYERELSEARDALSHYLNAAALLGTPATRSAAEDLVGVYWSTYYSSGFNTLAFAEAWSALRSALTARLQELEAKRKALIDSIAAEFTEDLDRNTRRRRA